jgi:hypothetical protein
MTAAELSALGIACAVLGVIALVLGIIAFAHPRLPLWARIVFGLLIIGAGTSFLAVALGVMVGAV